MEIGNDMILDEMPVDSIPYFSSFIRSSYFNNMSTFKAYRHIPFEHKSTILNNKADYILKNCKVMHIRDKYTQNLIYGYAAYMVVNKSLILHFIYIKKPFRNIGLAKKLVEQLKQNCDIFEYVILKDLRKYSLFNQFKLNKSYM